MKQTKPKFFCATELEAKILPEAQIHGIGILETALNLDFTAGFDIAIQFGICGVYPKYVQKYPVGSVVLIAQDTLGDLGSSSPNGFLTPKEMNLTIPSTFAMSSEVPELWKHLPLLKALTVQQCTGTIEHAQTRELLGAEVESMEGAAFYRACQKAGMPCLQIRAISNIASIRDFTAWDIPLALKNLKDELCKLT